MNVCWFVSGFYPDAFIYMSLSLHQYTYTTLSYYYSFIICPEIKLCKIFKLVLLKNYFGYSISFAFPYILESSCQFLQKTCWDFEWAFIEKKICRSVRENYNILRIVSFIRGNDMFLHLFCFLLISLNNTCYFLLYLFRYCTSFVKCISKYFIILILM